MIALHLFAVLALVGINAFFSAAEFSLVAVRQSRVRQLVEKGDARAKVVESLLTDLSRVVSGVQVVHYAGEPLSRVSGRSHARGDS